MKLLIGSLIPPAEEPEGVTPGEQFFSTPGEFQFTVPEYNELVVEVWGGGASTYFSGTGSSFNAEVFAGGGSKMDEISITGGIGGTGSGGDVNQTGGTGGNGKFTSAPGDGKGGDSPNGGTGGARGTTTDPPGPAGDGGVPGAGGGGRGAYANFEDPVPDQVWWDSAGGGGGYSKKTYAPGDLTVDALVAVVVGAGGAQTNATSEGGTRYGDSGQGGRGEVYVSWT